MFGLCLGCAELDNMLLPQRKGATAVEDLDTGTIGNQTVLLLKDGILLTGVLGKSPVAGHNHQLTAREFKLGTTEGLNDLSLVGILGADGHDGLTNVHTGDLASRLTIGTAHTRLQTIGTSA